MRKRCPSCGETKEDTAFGRNRSLKDGLSFYCLECNRRRNTAWYREHRRSLGKEVRDHSWIPDGFRWCPECQQPVAHEDYTRSSTTPSGFGGRCKPCHRAASSDAYFYRTYKITKRELAEFRAAQNDRCAICNAPEPQHLDHDHFDGRIRRLLCQRCNHGLGLFRDDPYLLRMAALYLETHREQPGAPEEQDRVGDQSEVATPLGTSPVGSQRRPATHDTTTRSTGRTSGARRRQQAGEADG
jgi:hypothetical protein